MNKIIKELLDWCKDNGYGVNIDICGNIGGVYGSYDVDMDSPASYAAIKLFRNGRQFSRIFCIPGDTVSSENWELGYCDLSLKNFLEAAEEEFGGES